jgi:Histidine phosphatase superfamily (branch 2)
MTVSIASPLLKQLLLLSSMSTLVLSAELSLTEVHVITRHGSRLPLIKDADSLDEGGPGTLTSLGQKMHFDLGTWLRSNYNNNTGFFDTYFSSLVEMRSSSLQRTIVSANSLAYGLFPASSRDIHNESMLPYNIAANIPVFSEKTENDVTIRGYEKCEQGIRLQELYVSPEWKAMESDHLDLLEKIGQIELLKEYNDPLLQRVLLENLWNVYDAIEVVKTECGFNPDSMACRVSNPSLQSVLSEDDWIELRDLAFKAELMKYSSKKAGKLAGGLLLQMILSRMKENKHTTMSKFYLYSAHYPTLLGVMAALESDPQDLIPSYAAALIFELYTDVRTSEKSVRILLKQGYETNTTEELILGQGCSGSKYCPLSDLNSSFIGDFSAARWCQACKYDKADICYAANLTALMKEHESQHNSVPRYAAALIGMFVGIAFALFCMTMLYYSRKPSRAKTNDTQEVEEGDQVDGIMLGGERLS